MRAPQRIWVDEVREAQPPPSNGERPEPEHGNPCWWFVDPSQTDFISPSRWMVKKMVKRPCCVCFTSICSAMALTSVMLVGLASGNLVLELDTSASSFRVKDDSISDRGDALAVFVEGSTSRSPDWVEQGGGSGCQFGTCDTERFEEASYYFAPWDETQVYFEARNSGEDEGGALGSNVFSEQAMVEIRRFETELRALPSFVAHCERSAAGVALGAAADVSHCLPFGDMPTRLGYGSKMTTHFMHCCQCNGTTPVLGESCISMPLCSSDDGSENVSVIHPDGRQATPLKALDEVLGRLWAATQCETPLLPDLDRLLSMMDRHFATTQMSATTKGSLILGGVVDLRSVGSAKSGTRFKEVHQQWNDKLLPAISDFYFYEVIPLTERFNDDSQILQIAMQSPHHMQYEVMVKSLPSAMLWASFSTLFIVLYMTWHLGSPLIAFAGLAHVLISFPTTWFFYYYAFEIKYMGILNFVSFFVILGIGADDIFVFTDAFRQSRLERTEISGTLEDRLYWTYRRAAGTMLVTSATDACAFYVLSLNGIVVVRTFGIFMGTMVIINYALVITYFPAIIVLYHQWGFEDTLECTHRNCDPKVDMEIKQHCLERFFGEFYAPKVLRHRSGIIIAVFVLLVILFGIACSFLSPPDKDFRAQMFPDDSNLMRALDMSSRFETAGFSELQVVYFVVGLGPDASEAINRKNVDPNNPNDYGTPIFTKMPEWSPAAQNHLLSICESFQRNPLVISAAAALRSPSNPCGDQQHESGVSCFAHHFRDWAEALEIGFPVPASRFESLLAEFTAMPTNSSCAEPRCRAYYETLLCYPSVFRNLHDTGQNAWDGSVRWSTSGKRESLHDGPGGELVGLLFEMNISMGRDVSGYNARDIFDQVEATAESLNDIAYPEDFEALQGFQVHWGEEESGSKWMQMRTDEVIVKSAWVGTAISVLFAFVTLTVATGNYIITLLAIVSIACILVCCIGFMVLCGWSLGMIEAICCTVCVGFSIDFVAHVAVAYSESDRSLSSYERTKRALEELGVSVTAATATTVGAATFMLPNRLVPFQKIGLFVIFDMTISLLFAVGFFAALLVVAGPEGETGNLKSLDPKALAERQAAVGYGQEAAWARNKRTAQAQERGDVY